EQSRGLLNALENDVRAMNARTEIVTAGTERLIGHLTSQSQRIGDAANYFDLQIASMAQRMENAAGTVMESNTAVIHTTHRQITESQLAVQDMVQRLGILSQLTGTMGSVAGQLGQIIPALGEVGHLPRITVAEGSDAATTERLEKVAETLQESVQ